MVESRVMRMGEGCGRGETEKKKKVEKDKNGFLINCRKLIAFYN